MDQIILEIRAGAGGNEAGLFAQELLSAYHKYAGSKGWNSKIIDQNQNELGGIKQATLQIKGDDVFNSLKNEGGVHRVQRIPKTEKAGRIHTSTISVAVLRLPKETEVNIKQSDLKTDFFKSSGAGGQNVNKRMTAIRITHIPSGIVVSSQVQRNLDQNRQFAMNMLRAKLYKQELEKSQGSVDENRRSQIGTADRSEKIRTYNFPQDRITDHRIGKKFHNIEKVMQGELEPIIKKMKELIS